MRNKFMALQKIAKDFIKDEFNLNSYPSIDYIEEELGFASSLEERDGKYYIVFAPDEWEEYEIDTDYEMLLNVLLHECVRYALIKQNKPYTEKDAYFINETYKRGLISDFEGFDSILEILVKNKYESADFAKLIKKDSKKAEILMEDKFKKYKNKYLNIILNKK